MNKQNKVENTSSPKPQRKRVKKSCGCGRRRKTARV